MCCSTYNSAGTSQAGSESRSCKKESTEEESNVVSVSYNLFSHELMK